MNVVPVKEALCIVTCTMLLCLQERTSEDSKEAESFQQLLTARIQEFVEEVTYHATHIHVDIPHRWKTFFIKVQYTNY